MPLNSDSIINIQPGSSKAKELAKINVFLMDEALLLPKYGLHNMDQLLRSTRNNDIPFGRKIVVFGRDFQQCLLVQPRANCSELIDLFVDRKYVCRSRAKRFCRIFITSW